MFRTILTAIIATIVCAIPVCGQRTTSKKTAKTETTLTAKGPVVIAIEDGKAYVDTLAEKVMPGDILVVYKCDTYFTHPITGERIPREATNIAELEVENVFSNYIQTHPKPAMAIAMIKPGMSVRKSTAIKPVEQPVAIQSETSSIPPAPNRDQNLIELIAMTNETLSAAGEPVEITFDGNTVYYNCYAKNNDLYKALKKKHEKGKLLSDKDRMIIEKDVIYVVAHKSGHPVVRRWWNKDRSEHFIFFNK